MISCGVASRDVTGGFHVYRGSDSLDREFSTNSNDVTNCEDATLLGRFTRENIDYHSLKLDKYLADTAKWIASMMNAALATMVYQDDYQKYHIFTDGKFLTAVNNLIDEDACGVSPFENVPEMLKPGIGDPEAESRVDRELSGIFRSENPLLIKSLGKYSPKIFGEGFFSNFSLLYVPIREDSYQCTLCLIGRKDETSFDQSDYHQIEQLIPHLISEIERVRKLSDLAEGTAGLMLLNRVANLLGQTMDLEELLAIVMKTTEETIGAEASSIMFLDDEAGELYSAVSRDEKPDKVPEIRIKLGEGVAGWVAKTGKPVILSDVERDPRFAGHVEKLPRFTTRNIICAPMNVKGKIIGIIEAFNKTGGFSRDDLSLFTSIATQAAYAIDNAQLFTRVKNQSEKLETLYNVGKIIAASLDNDALISEIIKCTARLIPCRAVTLAVVEETGEHEILRFSFLHLSGEDPVPEKIDRTPYILKGDTGIAGWIIRNNRPVLVDDLAVDPRYRCEIDRFARFEVGSILGCPCEFKGKVLGAILTCNPRDVRHFSREEQETLAMFAAQAAIAMENALLYSQLEESYLDSVQALANSLDANDRYTFGHSERVTEYSLMMAESMTLSMQELKILHFAALLHDIGKIGIDKRIVNKPGALTEEEFAKIKKHPGIGSRIIAPIRFMEEKLPGVRHHHERFDGRGYPDGLKGGDIPLFARIIAVADSFDAMTSHRSYRYGMSSEEAIQKLVDGKDTQFDPEIVDIFVREFNDGYAATFAERQMKVFDIQESIT